MDEAFVVGEAEVVRPRNFPVESAVVQPLKAKAVDGVNLVSEAPHYRDQAFWQVLVEKDPHAAERWSDRASSVRTSRIDS